MSKFSEMGFSGPIKASSATPEVDGYVVFKNGHPYHVHSTATALEWAALQEVISELEVLPFEPPVIPKLSYSQLRRSEYPSVEDQLDTLYHGGYDAWKATIAAVKSKYPKG